MSEPIVAVCPHCRAKLKLKNPELVGRKVRCPGCSEPFQVNPHKPAAGASSQAKAKPAPKPGPAASPEDDWLAGADSYGDEAAATSGPAPPPMVRSRKKRKAAVEQSSTGPGRKALAAAAGKSRPLLWVVGGSIGGALGAGIWAAVTAASHYQVGWVAIGVGGLVGLGVRLTAHEEEDVGLGPGVVALILALVAVAAGKWLTADLVAGQIKDQFSEMFDSAVWTSDEAMIAVEADGVVEEWIAQDKPVEWPEASDDSAALEDPDEMIFETLDEEEELALSWKEGYPADVWAEAEQRWKALSSEEQEQRREQRGQGLEEDWGELEGALLKGLYGPLDVLFFLLAAATAFKVGTGIDWGDDDD